MEIAIITDAFPPMRTSGAVQLRDLATEFLKQGHRPVIITPAPELVGKWTLEDYRGIRVLRVKTLKIKDVNKVRRAFAEMLMSPMILLRLYQSGLSQKTWDGIIWYSPSIFFGLLILYLKKKHKCPSYLILRDIFPEWAVDMGLMRRGGIPYQIFKIFEKIQYWTADTIGIQSESSRPYLHRVLKQKTPQIDLLHNWLADYTLADCPIKIDKTMLAGRKICAYVGNMGVAQDVGIFINLASDMQDRHDIGFLFVGRGSEVQKLKQRAKDEALSNVMFCNEIDPDEISGLLAQCHIGMLALDPRHTTNNIPGKFLTYMRDSLPVLACVNSGNELIATIKKNRVGFVSNNRNLKELKEGLLALLHSGDDQMVDRCRAVYQDFFSPAVAIETIAPRLQSSGLNCPSQS